MCIYIYRYIYILCIYIYALYMSMSVSNPLFPETQQVIAGFEERKLSLRVARPSGNDGKEKDTMMPMMMLIMVITHAADDDHMTGLLLINPPLHPINPANTDSSIPNCCVLLMFSPGSRLSSNTSDRIAAINPARAQPNTFHRWLRVCRFGGRMKRGTRECEFGGWESPN